MNSKYERLKNLIKHPFLLIIEKPYSDLKHKRGILSLNCNALSYIFIYYKMTDDEKFITLAHEYGHYISWKENMRPSEYEEAMNIYSIDNNKLSIDQKLLIFDEEKRAWDEGEKFIKRNKIQQPLSFYEDKERALTAYQKYMNI